jgi:tetratricopeptide (TPR) repeat protein
VDAGRDLAAETRASPLTLTAEHESVAAAFELSYRHLDPARQRTFRLLGLHPGTSFDGYAAAALTETSLDEAAALLDGLHGEGLLTETGHRRYGLHDLLRRYARDHAAAGGPAEDARQAPERLLDYYQYTAARADALLARQARLDPLPATLAGLLAVPDMDDEGQALAWARADCASLLACLDHATATGQHARVIAFTAALAEFLRWDGPWADAIARHATAVQAAQCVGDRRGQANALLDLGNVRRLTGDYLDAAEMLEQALDIYRHLGHRRGLAHTLNGRAVLHRVSGDLARAEECHQQALELARAIASLWDEAHALAGLGRCAMVGGHATQAEALLRQALEVFQRIGAAEAPDVLAELDALTSQAE